MFSLSINRKGKDVSLDLSIGYESFNITHNLIEIAQKAGLYKCLWCPEENGYRTAHQIIEPLEHGIKHMACNRDEYEKLNPENGWGSYDDFLLWLTRVLASARRNPDGKLWASR